MASAGAREMWRMGLLFAMRHGLGNDLVHLVSCVSHRTKHGIRRFRSSTGGHRLYSMVKLALTEQADGLLDCVLLGSEVAALDLALNIPL